MEPRRTYGISPARRTLLYGSWVIFALPLLAGGFFTGETGLLVAALLVTVAMLPVILWADWAARLIVSPEGVELRQAGATLQSPWANVAALRVVSGGEGFILHEPMAGRGAERFALTAGVRVRGAALYDEDRLRLITARRFIPIEAFAYWLRRGDLRTVLTQWAPHVPIEGTSGAAGSPTSPEPVPRQGRRSLLTIGVIVLLVGGALALALALAGTQAAVLRFLLLPVALVFVLLAARNFSAAFRLVRIRHFWFALLWAAMAVVQVLVALTLAAQFIGAKAP